MDLLKKKTQLEQKICPNCIHFKVCAVKPKHYKSCEHIHGKVQNIEYENPVKCKHFISKAENKHFNQLHAMLESEIE
jgi:hypothetical protein